MSISRQIKRNAQRQTDNYLKQKQSVMQPGWQNATPEQKRELAQMFRNGITTADLEREYWRGVQDTWKEAAPSVQKAVYAAVAVVMKEAGNTTEDVLKILYEVDQKLLTLIDTAEIADEMLKKCGIEFDGKDGIERVRIVE